jgi:hypothetical protein
MPMPVLGGRAGVPRPVCGFSVASRFCRAAIFQHL